jgi:hypothetical protein
MAMRDAMAGGGGTVVVDVHCDASGRGLSVCIGMRGVDIEKIWVPRFVALLNFGDADPKNRPFVLKFVFRESRGTRGENVGAPGAANTTYNATRGEPDARPLERRASRLTRARNGPTPFRRSESESRSFPS